MSDPRLLFVPIRSNAKSLVTGAPVASVRRRLKAASVFFDHLYLEAGIQAVSAGPHGSSSFIMGSSPELPAKWETPAARSAATAAPFTVAVGTETKPGMAAETMHTVIHSESTISWTATLEPFSRELPSDCDWVDYVDRPPLSSDGKELAKQWTELDKRNAALQREMPIGFVRNCVVDHVNGDLATAATHGAAVSMDAFHSNVFAQRLHRDGSWRGTAFAIALVLPQVEELPWGVIAEIRRNPKVVSFRDVLREVEAEAYVEAQGGDLEAAVHHAYERHLAAAVGKLDVLGGALKKLPIGFGVGLAAGFLTAGLTGPGGVVGSTAIGAIGGLVLDLRDARQRLKRHGWVGIHQYVSAGGIE